MKIPHEKFSLLIQALIELLVGLLYISNLESLMEYPVILFLIPALMSLRGAIYGVLALRVTTLLYLGEAKPTLKDTAIRVEIFLSLLRSLIASFILASLTFTFDVVFFEGILHYGMLITLSLFTNTLSFLFIALPSLLLLLYYFKRGKSIEFIGVPYVSSFADLITPFVLFLSLPISFDSFFQIIFLSLLLISLVLIFLRIQANAKLREVYLKVFRSMSYKENFYVVSLIHTLYASISGLGGLFFARTIFIKEIQEILVIAPAYNALLGSLGGILSSKISVPLHLGLETKLTKIIGDTKLAFFSFYSGLLIVSVFSNPLGIIIVIFSSILTVTLITLISYYVSKIEFERGFDPDIYTFPMISSVGDIMGPASLVVTTLIVLSL